MTDYQHRNEMAERFKSFDNFSEYLKKQNEQKLLAPAKEDAKQSLIITASEKEIQRLAMENISDPDQQVRITDRKLHADLNKKSEQITHNVQAKIDKIPQYFAEIARQNNQNSSVELFDLVNDVIEYVDGLILEVKTQEEEDYWKKTFINPTPEDPNLLLNPYSIERTIGFNINPETELVIQSLESKNTHMAPHIKITLKTEGNSELTVDYGKYNTNPEAKSKLWELNNKLHALYNQKLELLEINPEEFIDHLDNYKEEQISEAPTFNEFNKEEFIKNANESYEALAKNLYLSPTDKKIHEALKELYIESNIAINEQQVIKANINFLKFLEDNIDELPIEITNKRHIPLLAKDHGDLGYGEGTLVYNHPYGNIINGFINPDGAVPIKFTLMEPAFEDYNPQMQIGFNYNYGLLTISLNNPATQKQFSAYPALKNRFQTLTNKLLENVNSQQNLVSKKENKNDIRSSLQAIYKDPSDKSLENLFDSINNNLDKIHINTNDVKHVFNDPIYAQILESSFSVKNDSNNIQNNNEVPVINFKIEKQPRVLGEQEKVSLSYNYNNHPFKIIMPGYNSEKVQLIQNFYNKVIEQLPDEHPAKSN